MDELEGRLHDELRSVAMTVGPTRPTPPGCSGTAPAPLRAEHTEVDDG